MRFKNETVNIPMDVKKILRTHDNVSACVVKAIQGKHVYNLVMYHPVSEQFMTLVEPGDQIQISGYDVQHIKPDNTRIHTMVVDKFMLR